MEYKERTEGGIRFIEATGAMQCPGYMPVMIRKNPGKIFVPFDIEGNSDKCRIYYKTDLLIPARTFLEDYGACEQWVMTFLHSVDALLAYCGEYLIDPDFISMDLRRIYQMGHMEPASFLFTPFSKVGFHEACRKTVAEILGNYFSDHAVSGEVFRERLLRKTADMSFNPRNILSDWENLLYVEKSAEPGIIVPKPPPRGRKRDFLRELLPVQKPASEETTVIGTITAGVCLTGICSINTRIPVDSVGVTVGRTMLQKDFGLYNSGIGRVHARVYEQSGQIFVTDLGSRNGTYVNGEKIGKRTPVIIEKGDIVAFSDEEFILC